VPAPPTTPPSVVQPGRFDFINNQTSCAMTLSGGTAILSWTASTGAVNYRVEGRQWSTGVWISQVTTAKTSFTEGVANVDWYFRVFAISSTGHEQKSDQGERGTCTHVEPPPPTPTPTPTPPGNPTPPVVIPPGTTCSYTLATSSSIPRAGGNIGVSVNTQSGCTWSAGSNASWIHVVGGASGSGNGTVLASVDSNTTGSQRVGTLTIAGQTYTVTQAG
jgi:S-formylglutathione hydrolase FrmB